MKPRLSPALERAIRNTFRERAHWGAYGVDDFLAILVNELSREQSDEARRYLAPAKEAAQAEADPVTRRS